MGCCCSQDKGKGGSLSGRREPLIDLDDEYDSSELEEISPSKRIGRLDEDENKQEPMSSLTNLVARLRLEDDGTVHFSGQLKFWSKESIGEVNTKKNTKRGKAVEEAHDWHTCHCLLNNGQLTILPHEKSSSPHRTIKIRRLECQSTNTFVGAGKKLKKGKSSGSDADEKNSSGGGKGKNFLLTGSIASNEVSPTAGSSLNGALASTAEINPYEFTLQTSEANKRHKSDENSAVRLLAPNYLEHRLWLKAVAAALNKKSKPYEVHVVVWCAGKPAMTIYPYR